MTPLVFLAASPLARAGCDPADLDPHLDAVEVAFERGDVGATASAYGRARRTLGCTTTPLPASTCARIHRAHALERYVRADLVGAEGALRAMVHADPTADLPTPLDHPLRWRLTSAEETQVHWTIGESEALVDGLRTAAVPQGQPYVLQELDQGIVARTRLIHRVELPHLAARHDLQRTERRLWHAGLGAGASSVLLYTAALLSRGGYNRAVRWGDNDLIKQRHAATNGLTITSVTAALLAGAGMTYAEVRHRSLLDEVDDR